MKLQCILNILVICQIFVIICLLGAICISLSILVKKLQLLAKIHQNQFFIYFGGFKYLVYYILIACYSLDPVLVIWYVILINFLEIQCHSSKLKKLNFGMLNLGHLILGKQMF